MKTIKLILLFLAASVAVVNGQTCLNNPSIQAGDIDPAPLVNGQGGVLSFTYTENGDDYTEEENDPVTLTICMLNIGPVAGTASIGGTFASTFDWIYDGVSNCFLGTQNQDILGGSGGTITVDFVQTNSIACPTNQMGFNANIQPAACMNGVNQVNDDNESSFTCNLVMPALLVSDITVNEDAGTAMVDICLSETVGSDVTFDYGSSDDTAIDGSDYTGASGMATVTAGQLCTTVSFSITDDALDELDETFLVDISNVSSNATIADGQGTVTILDNDLAPSISVIDLTVNENAGTASVQICAAAIVGSAVTVDYSTANGSATSGSDYSGTLVGTATILAGNQCTTITYNIVDDTTDEPNENYFVNINNPVGGTIGDGQGEVTILDNDETPSLSVSDLTVNEDAGTASVQVCADMIVAASVSVDYSTSNGSATSGSDYSGTLAGTATITGGSQCTTITYNIIDDVVDESDENYFVNISNPSGATISDNLGEVTILDNDDPPVVPGISVSDDVVIEGNVASVMVCLDQVTTVSVSVDLNTANVTAVSPGDYASMSTTITIPAGQLCQTVMINTVDDSDIEGSESFNVVLSSPVNGIIVDPLGVVTILDNDMVNCAAQAPVITGN